MANDKGFDDIFGNIFDTASKESSKTTDSSGRIVKKTARKPSGTSRPAENKKSFESAPSGIDWSKKPAKPTIRDRRRPIDEYMRDPRGGVAKVKDISYKNVHYDIIYMVQLQDNEFGQLPRRIGMIAAENDFNIVDLQFSQTMGYEVSGDAQILEGHTRSALTVLYNAFVVFTPVR